MITRIFSPSKKDDGFTLIELLVVVIIIGVLAALALPIFIDQRKVAIDAAVKSDVHNTALAVQEWRVDHQNATAADAASYIAQSGHLVATRNNGYLGVVVNSDGSFGVCGYNPNGAKLTSPSKSFVFEGVSGKFGIGTGCHSGVGYISTGNTGDGTPTGDPQNGAEVPTPANSAPPAGGSYRLDPGPDAPGPTDPQITETGSGGSDPLVPGLPGGDPGPKPADAPSGHNPGGNDNYKNPYTVPAGTISPSTGGYWSNWYNTQYMNITAANNPSIDPDNSYFRVTGATPYHDALNGTEYAYLVNGTVTQTLTPYTYGNGMKQTSAQHSLQAYYVDNMAHKTGERLLPMYTCAGTGLAGACDFYAPFNTDNFTRDAAGFCANVSYNAGYPYERTFGNVGFDHCIGEVNANN